MKKLFLSLPLIFAIYHASASSFSLYDPFADATAQGGSSYTAGSFLAAGAGAVTVQTNAYGFQWFCLSNYNGAAAAMPVITNDNLSYSGLPSSSGNSVFIPAGGGTMGRVTLPFTNGASLSYYSFKLKVTDVSTLSTSATSNFFAAFGDTPGSAHALLVRAESYLVAKKSGAGYVLGIGKNKPSAANTYDSTVRNVGDTLFVVASYDYTTTGHPASLWINPSSSTFGTATPPTATVSTTTGSDLNSPGIDTFMLGCYSNAAPPSCVVDDVRVATTWAIATGLPEIEVQPTPASQSKNAGNSASITMNAMGGSLTYQWTRNGVNVSDDGNISGSSSATISIASVTQANAGSYTVIITNSSGAVTSSVVTMSVTDPIITSQPSNQSLSPGAMATFQVSAIGDAPLSYQWVKGATVLSNGGNISGSSSATLTVAAVSISDDGSYSVYVTNALGSVLQSSAATLSVTDPAITGEPQSVTNNYGTAATFQVTAVGSTPFSYQWHRAGVGDLSNGGNISGSQSAVLTLTGVSYTDAGSYSVTVTNVAGTVDSTTATLSVIEPIIVTQPASATNPVGSTATLSVSAVGAAPITYQWTKNSVNLTDGGAVTGSSSATLTITPIASGDAASYNVLVADASGTNVLSATAILTVLNPPSFVSQPNSRTVVAGNNVAFAVAATGDGALAYQWFSNNVAVSGATSFALALTNVQSAMDGSYDVVVTNAEGAVTSSVALLEAVASIQLYNTNLIIIRAGDGAQTQTLNGNPVYLDQFTTAGNYVNTVCVPASGASALIEMGLDENGSTLTGTALARSANNRYLVLSGYNTPAPYTNGLEASTSASVPRGVGLIDASGQFTLAIADTNAYSSTYFRGAAADGTNNYWGAAAANGTYYFGLAAAAATIQSSSANLRSVDIFNGNLYTVSGAGGGTGILKWSGLPTHATAATTLFAPTPVPSDIAVDSTGTNIYVGTSSGVMKWQFDGTSWSSPYTLNTGGVRYLTADFSGPSPVIYTTTSDATFNRLVAVTDTGAGSTVTTLVTVGTNQTFRGIRFGPTATPATVAIPPQSQYAVSGSTVVLTATAAGDTPISYQWSENSTNLADGATGSGSAISGSSTAALTISDASAADDGSYSITVMNNSGTNASSAAVLTVIDGVSISSGPATQTNNYDDTVTLSVSATGGGTLAYAWKKGNTVLSNGGNISGSSTAILTLSPVAFSDGATYTAIVSNQGSTNSAAGVLTVNDPAITTQPAPQSVACNGNATFSVVANGSGTLTYQWQLGGTALTDGAGISGSSSSSLNLSGVTLLQSGGQYSVVVTGSESVTSSVVSLTVQDTTPPMVTIIGATTTNIECGSSFTDPGATANDACAGSTSITTSGSVNTSATGTYILTYSSTDPSSNTGTATRTVIVGDSTPPVITLTGASTTNIECASSFSDPGATANDACAGSESVTSSGSVNTGTIGTYLLTYVVSDNNGKSATNTRTVNVVDTTPPVVTANATNVTTECHQVFSDPGATANDTCAGSLSVTTSSDLDPNTVGTYTITYSSTDPSTNTGTATLTVTVVDTTPPVITLNGASPMTVAQPSTYSEPGATANDACAGSVSVSTSGVVDSSTIGTYYVTYIASDPSGNSATNVRTVIVSPLQAPTITIQPTNVTVNAGLNATFTVASTSSELVYQWYKGTNALSDGAAYSGSTNATLTVSNVLHASEGSYSVIVSNSSGPATSTNAVLTVIDPVVSVSPANATNYIGSLTPTVFTATGAGTPTLHYQWYSSNTTTHVLAKLSGKTSASFSVTSFATSTPTAYVVVVTNQLSAPNSATATASLVIEPAVTIKTKPKATTTVYAGDNVLFTTAGNNTLQYQWSFVSGGSTNTLAGQTAASLSLTNAGPANMGTYDCTLTGLATLDGGEVAPVASAVLVVNPDPQPKVSIVSPKNKAILTNNAVEAGISGSVTNPTMVIDGKLTDKGLVTDVAIVRTFPSALSAAATLFGGPAKQSWTNDSIVLADGTNVFNVFATNVSGNVGSNTLSVFSANTQQLTIVTIGSGTYKHVGSTTYGSTDWTGDTNAYPVLQNTRHYGIEAIPAANCIFSNWMNGATVVSTNPTYTLTMSSGLTLTANVPANPLANLAGVYNGMVTATNGLTNTAASGTIEVTVKSNYTKFAFPFSGKVVFGRTSYALTGGFNNNGQYTGQTVTGGFPVSMNVDWTSGSNQIYGTVAGNSFTAGLEITAPADTLADGAYYLPLPVDTGAWTNYGYATVGVTNGGVKVSGKTYDGGAFTETTTVDKQGRIPFYTFSSTEIQAAALSAPDNTNTISGTVAFNGGVVSLQSASATNGLPALGSTVTVGTNTVPVLGALYPQVATPTMAAGIVTLSYKSSLHAAVIKGYGIMNGANGVVGSIKTGNGGATYVPFTIK